MTETTISLRIDPVVKEWTPSLTKAMEETGVELTQVLSHIVDNTIELRIKYDRPEQLYQLGEAYTREVQRERERITFRIKEGGATGMAIPTKHAERFRANFPESPIMHMELADFKQMDEHYYIASIRFTDAAELFYLGMHYGRDQALDDFGAMVDSMRWSRDDFYKKAKEQYGRANKKVGS